MGTSLKFSLEPLWQELSEYVSVTESDLTQGSFENYIDTVINQRQRRVSSIIRSLQRIEELLTKMAPSKRLLPIFNIDRTQIIDVMITMS